MAAPVAEPKQAPSEEQVLAAMVVVMLSAQAPPATAGALVSLLSSLAVPSTAAVDAVGLWLPHFEHLPEATGPGSSWQRRTEVVRRCQYLVKAARRLMAGGTLDAERRYLAQHLAAVRARKEAVAQVDAQARRHGPVLGWYAIRDSRTDPICRALDGTNFEAAKPPAVGYPGSLHGGTCRCKAGAPYPSAISADEAFARFQQREADGDTQPFAVELSSPFERLRSVLSRSHPEK